MPSFRKRSAARSINDLVGGKGSPSKESASSAFGLHNQNLNKAPKENNAYLNIDMKGSTLIRVGNSSGIHRSSTNMLEVLYAGKLAEHTGMGS